MMAVAKTPEVIEALRGGDRIMVTNPRPDTEETVKYGLMRAGKTVTRTTFSRIFNNLKPISDGLFGSEVPQTFEWGDDDG